MIFVTGGAGFIGSNFVLDWLAQDDEPVLNVDQLNYAGNRHNLAALQDDPRHVFVRADIGDAQQVSGLLERYRPRAIVHFAAETHVDRSILAPAGFVATNIDATFRLLEAARSYWSALAADGKRAFRFLQVSTDEVYGSLGPHDAPFTESSPYAPNNPYSATKAAADHLVRAVNRTYGLPTLTANCSNNYGPYQFPEKLIPLTIMNALAGDPLPVYGDGLQVRDWLYVGDHCAALRRILAAGTAGAVYNIGGHNEIPNIEVVRIVCDILDRCAPKPASYRAQLAFVPDRPGHDRRYAIDASKLERELGWKPADTFETGIVKTVAWYLANPGWLAAVRAAACMENRRNG